MARDRVDWPIPRQYNVEDAFGSLAYLAFYFAGGFIAMLVEANFGLFSAQSNGGGVAFFAHVGRFLFGALVTWALTSAGRVAPQEQLAAPTWSGAHGNP